MFAPGKAYICGLSLVAYLQNFLKYILTNIFLNNKKQIW